MPQWFSQLIWHLDTFIGPALVAIVVAFLEWRATKTWEVRIASFGFDLSVVGLGGMCELWVHANKLISPLVVLITSVLGVVACVAANWLRRDVEELQTGAAAFRQAKQGVIAGAIGIMIAIGISLYLALGGTA